MTGVVIPARDEARTVGRVVRAARDALPGALVVVVDDASGDATTAAARAAGARVVRLDRHHGYAGALRVGYASALADGADVIVQLDADGQHDPADAHVLLDALARYDLVLGSRFLGPGYRMPVGRRAGIQACRAMARTVGGLRLTDPTSGFRAIRRPLAARIATEGFPDGLTESSFLIRAHRAGHAIGEVPVRMSPPPNGSMHDGVRGVVHLARIALATAGLAVFRNHH